MAFNRESLPLVPSRFASTYVRLFDSNRKTDAGETQLQGGESRLQHEKDAGSFGERVLYRLWLLRSIRRLRADCNDQRIWKETALQALRFRTPDPTSPVRPPALDTR